MNKFSLLFLVAIGLMVMGSSCNNKSSPSINTCLQGKIIQKWCYPSNLAIIQILSNEKLGEDWNLTVNSKKYNNTVLAQFDSTLFKEVSLFKDSTFYFNYDLKIPVPNGMCYKCCPPAKFISVTSISQNQCITNK